MDKNNVLVYEILANHFNKTKEDSVQKYLEKMTSDIITENETKTSDASKTNNYCM